MKLVKIFVVVTLSLSIFACAPIWQTRTTNNISPELLADLRADKIKQLTNWSLTGRTIITQNKEAINVGLRWQEYDDHYQIKLEGPFSQGGVTLEGRAHHVTLATSDGKHATATTPEQLIKNIVGWELPISALRDWTRGLPSLKQDISQADYNDKGQLIHLVQHDWNIQFLRYIPFEDMEMPGKIFIKHPDLSMRLIISDWDRP